LDDPLAQQFPTLQASVTIGAQGVARLHRSLSLGKASIVTYYDLAYGRACDQLSESQFRDLVLAISRKPGGGSRSG
jgi:hypothetical protein